VYHLLKRKKYSLELKLLITGEQIELLEEIRDIDKAVYNYFTEAIILNNRIKNRARQYFTSIILPLELNYKLKEKLKQLELFLKVPPRNSDWGCNCLTLSAAVFFRLF
jgi:hypothetical protein